MPNAQGQFKGISIPHVPWHKDKPKKDEKKDQEKKDEPRSS